MIEECSKGSVATARKKFLLKRARGRVQSVMRRIGGSFGRRLKKFIFQAPDMFLLQLSPTTQVDPLAVCDGHTIVAPTCFAAASMMSARS